LDTIPTMLSPSTSDPSTDLVGSFKRPVIAGLAVGLVTALVSLFLPNYYKSEARISPADSKAAGGGMAGLAAAAGFSVPGQEGPDSGFVDILNSRSIREALLQKSFEFHQRNWRFGENSLRRQTVMEYLDEKDIDLSVIALRDKISVTRDLKSRLLTISVETRSPELSQQMVREMVHLLEEMVMTKAQTRGGVKAAFANKRLKEAREEMAHAEEGFRSFLDANRNYMASPDPAVRLKGLRLENELRLRTQLVTNLAIGLEQALLEEKNDLPILNVLDPGNLPIQKSKPSRSVMIMLATLLSTLGAWIGFNWPWVRTRLFHRGARLSAPSPARSAT